MVREGTTMEARETAAGAAPAESVMRLLLRHPDLWLMAAYGFVSGLPLPLSGFTLRQWMSEGHISLAAIGLTANIGISYSLKFLWAPVFDHVRPPLFLHRFGRRRGWLLAVQPLLVLACVLLAVSDPAHSVIACIAAAAAVAFLSASQDIGIDAWRIETFPQRLQGAAMAAYVWGYRVAMLVSGAGAIGLAGPLGWHGSLLLMAALLALGPVITIIAREPAASRLVSEPVRFLARISHAVLDPLREFLTRPGAVEILAFVMLFKLGEAMAGTMAPPFYRSLGFDRAAVALATGVPSLAASLLGAATGGWLVARIGPGRALIVTGFAQTASMLLYFALAASHGDTTILYAKVVVEAFAEAMADAAFITYLSGLCSLAYTATQYALLSSLAAVALRTVGGLSGFLAQALGWVDFYAVTVFAAVPAMLIMLHLMRRFPGERRVAAVPGE
jgi:MFS transporter, PAT family, beta-lactamase induction signal transducer AmpG